MYVWIRWFYSCLKCNAVIYGSIHSFSQHALVTGASMYTREYLNFAQLFKDMETWSFQTYTLCCWFMIFATLYQNADLWYLPLYIKMLIYDICHFISKCWFMKLTTLYKNANLWYLPLYQNDLWYLPLYIKMLIYDICHFSSKWNCLKVCIIKSQISYLKFSQMCLLDV